MTIQEMIDVLKAYQEGKEIEFKYITSDGSDWIITTKPSFNFNTCEYRVKSKITARKFRLIKTYPLSPSLGTIVEFKTEQNFNDGIYDVGAIPNLLLEDCIHFPEFWEEIIEEKIYTNKDDLVGRKCKHPNVEKIYKIVYQNSKNLILEEGLNLSTASYDYFNKNFKLC